jgi:hypothetical protein
MSKVVNSIMNILILDDYGMACRLLTKRIENTLRLVPFGSQIDCAKD